ncbi:HAD family hydrolase [Pseudomonas japonica]|uniref:HAD family hydrolase n=1 Tax=Pseudomonas japonica TaxID=256466 RepID=UPI0015E3D29A|nr:HAD family hydrolase [Pseudomonas japonica]MBA1290861.1 HAD family hydrolase [Pseudomonas japonica]
MSAPIRLVLSDMDGTLLRRDHSLTPAVVEAVRKLQAAGATFTLASSRPPRAMLEQARLLGVTAPIAGFNGGNLVYPDGRLLEAHTIAPQAVRAALAFFAEYPVDVWLFADGDWLLKNRDAAHLETERHALGYDAVQVADFEPYLDRVDKIVATTANHALLEQLEAAIQPVLGGQAHAARSQLYYLDITALEADKGKALARLARHLGVPLEETAVLGDGHNDVAMFEVAGLAIAMGQASADVREAADVVTDSNEQDGVASAIERFILPRVLR